MSTLDTHEFIEELVAAGFKKKQAEVITKGFRHNIDNLATKDDIGYLKVDIAHLREIMATTADLFDVRSELKEDMGNLKSELKEDISNLKYDIIKWVTPMFLANMAMIIGLWFK